MVHTEQFKAGLHWYCVRAKPKKERKAASNLATSHGIEVFCPQIRFRRKTVRGPVWFQEALFPCYFFARFDMSSMKRLVSYAPGVLTIPVFNNRYVPVPDTIIDSLQQDMDETGTVDGAVPLEVGDETTILEGSMRGLKVKVVRLLPARDRVAVLLEVLGTLVEAEFPADALEHKAMHRVTVEE